MPGKWKVEEIRAGAVMETTFWANPAPEGRSRFRATHLDGRRAPKVVLCDDERVRPGVPCLVRVKTVHRKERNDFGWIEVEFVRLLDFKLEGVYIDPTVARKLQILLESGLNILLDGPQGCGKTVLARAIATTLGMRFIFFNCGAVVEAGDFLAGIQIRASDSGHPVTEFIRTDVMLALEEAAGRPEWRYLIFLDEFNRCPESARNTLMPALDTTRRLFHPIRGVFFDIPDNVQFIAAVNRGQEFSGTFGIDAAQLDRFAPLQMDYMPVAEEVRLLQGRHPELSAKLVRTIVDLARRVRESAELERGLSVRATDEACIYLKHPLMEADRNEMLPEVLKSSFCGRFNGRWGDPTTDAGMVWSIIQQALREKKWKTAEEE